MFPIAILAGGLATRLRPITDKIPKALALVGGEPFIFQQLRLLKNRGFTDVVICAWYRGEMIRDYVQTGVQFGLNVTYSFDGSYPLGTAGAIKKALPILSENFFVLYGDSYLPCDYFAIQKDFLIQSKQGLMTIYKNDKEWDKSNVEFVNGKIRRYDKMISLQEMHYIDYGLGIFNASAFSTVSLELSSDLPEIYQNLIVQDQLAAYEVYERYYEIGSFSGLSELDQLLKTTPEFALEKTMIFSQQYFDEMLEIIAKLDQRSIESAAQVLAQIRKEGGRLFVLGVGGSAANASHAVNDFRKITGIETYAPTDNVSELTARTNDEGWASVFKNWLEGSHLRKNDALLIFSVGGGNLDENVSPNLVTAIQYAKSIGTKVIGVVGRDGGYTAQVADVCVLIPVVNSAHVTPHTEAFQGVITHLLVSHPLLKMNETKWESVK